MAAEAPLLIRPAYRADVADIARVYTSVWPDLTPNPAQISSAIHQDTHQALVALRAGEVVGFVDAFVTSAASGETRWEVDLLAVAPTAQGLGIGRALVAASTQAGRERGARRARALVQIDNIASQHVFAACGYQQAAAVVLYVFPTAPPANTTAGMIRCHHLLVQTFSYRGLWLEGDFDAADLAAAKAWSAGRGWQLVGTVLPRQRGDLIQQVVDAGFVHVDDYDWWETALR